MNKSRAEQRRDRRLYGWAGNRSAKKGKHRQRNALQSQMELCMVLWSRFAKGKSLDYLQENLSSFFKENIDSQVLSLEVAAELEDRIRIMLDHHSEEEKKTLANPIQQ